ncbi:TetR/AcrR family transcriptional regulator [Amycolatopsis orientalis]|uniref:TetR/AcrR family transcriptional regulator n=1 Tax=Amycolatopsis orientalis TaxID=31958 RepID=UPI0004145D31|nr:TetR/AcrR family transcriptional regulator [Amycolatopsis orientalis]
MGNREDLMAGAIQCLKEKGWSRTTVRDIAAAAGVSHAAIGYHFGSREALLLTAFSEAMDHWGKEVLEEMKSAVDPDASPSEQYRASWRAMIDSYGRNRQLWIASIEAFVQSEHHPELRKQLAAAQREGRRGMAAGVLGIDEDSLTEADERRIGAVATALNSGVMLQHMLDPENAPTADEVVDGLMTLVSLVS